MLPFYELPRRARIERLRRAALEVLALYRLEAKELRFVPSSHAVFRITARSGQRYILKFGIHMNIGHDHGLGIGPWIGDYGTDVYLQVHWQEALCRDTELSLQKPMRTVDGQLVPTIEVQDLHEPIECTLCTWLPGRVFTRSWPKPWPGVKMIRQIGKIAATLHEHAQRWSLPNGYSRPERGWERTAEDVLSVGLSYPPARAALSSGDRRLLVSAMDRVLSVFIQLGTDPRNFGLIHEDLCPQNLILCRGHLSPVDFGNVVFGYYLWDVVHTFGTPAFNTPQYKPRYQAYFAGYEEVRQLPDDFRVVLQAIFTYWGISQIYDSIVESPHAAQLVPEIKIPRALWLAERLVADEPFPEL